MLYFGEEEVLPGVTLKTYYCEDTQRIVHEYIQDVEPVIDFNTAKQNDFTSFKDMGFSGCMANIPAIVDMQWRREGFNWIKEPVEETIKRLNDPDNKYLKTVTKRL